MACNGIDGFVLSTKTIGCACIKNVIRVISEISDDIMRIPALPEVPTVAEAGVPGYDVILWHGLIGPKGLPAPIVERLNKEAAAALGLKESAEQLQNDGVVPAGGPAAQFGARIKQEIGIWRKVAADANVKVE